MKDKAKLIAIVLILIFVCVVLFIFLSSCNMRMVGSYKFTRVHVYYEGYEECLELKSWTDSEMGIEVDTVKYSTLFISEGHYLLCKDRCPICESKEA